MWICIFVYSYLKILLNGICNYTNRILTEEQQCFAGRKDGGRVVREFGTDLYTLLYLKWITNKVLLYRTGNSAQCCVAAWMRGEFGGERMHVHICDQVSLLFT